MSGTFCAPVAVEPTDEHKHLGLEPKNVVLHQTQECRKKQKKTDKEKEIKRKGRDGSLATFQM